MYLTWLWCWPSCLKFMMKLPLPQSPCVPAVGILAPRCADVDLEDVEPGADVLVLLVALLLAVVVAELLPAVSGAQPPNPWADWGASPGGITAPSYSTSGKTSPSRQSKSPYSPLSLEKTPTLES